MYSLNHGLIVAGSVYPAVNCMSSLGTTSNVWTSVYAATGTVSTSDSAVKDWEPLPYGLSDILGVTTIKYKWKSQAALPDDDPEKNYEYFGVCADQLDPLFPELIYNTQRPFMLNYSELIPVCINAIKDLSTQNVALSAKVDEITAQNVTILAQNAALGTQVDAFSARLSAANIA